MNKFEAAKQIKREAFHESGHAVIALFFDLPFESVSLRVEKRLDKIIHNGKEIDNESTYVVGVVYPEEYLERINDDLMLGKLDLREAVVSLAGPAAEHTVIGKTDESFKVGAQLDIQPIRACCRAAISNSDDIYKWKEVPEMEGPMLNAVTAGAKLLVRNHRQVIKAIADALLERKELSHSEVANIAEANGMVLKKR